MSAGRGFRRLWVVVSALWIAVSIGEGVRVGQENKDPAYTNYCVRETGYCQKDFPPEYASSEAFYADEQVLDRVAGRHRIYLPNDLPAPSESEARERWSRWQETTDVVKIPARVNLRFPALGALIGLAGAALLYLAGAAVGWVVRGFRTG